MKHDIQINYNTGHDENGDKFMEYSIGQKDEAAKLARLIYQDIDKKFIENMPIDLLLSIRDMCIKEVRRRQHEA